MRRFSRTGVAVHLLELRLERVIEQRVPVLSQKPEKRPHPMEALDQSFLLCRQLNRGIPSHHRFISSPSNWVGGRELDHFCRICKPVLRLLRG
jgi:hypothetical protein